MQNWRKEKTRPQKISHDANFVVLKDDVLFLTFPTSILRKIQWNKEAILKIPHSLGNYAETYGHSRFFNFGILDEKTKSLQRNLCAIVDQHLSYFGHVEISPHPTILSTWKDSLLVFYPDSNYVSCENLLEWQQQCSTYSKIFKLNRMGRDQPKKFCFSDEHLVMLRGKYVLVYTWRNKKWKDEKKLRIIKWKGYRDLVMLTSTIFMVVSYYHPQQWNSFMELFSIECDRITIIGTYQFQNNPLECNNSRLIPLSTSLLVADFFGCC